MFRALRFPAGILSIAIVSNTIEPTRKINPRTEMPIFVINLQSQICNALEKLEPSKKFTRQDWSRSEGGSGTSMILQDGTVFEKAGVNVSRIFGPLPKALEDQMRARKLDGIVCEGLQMFATGISVVIHPVNPNAPTAHLNYRYFELRDQNDKLVTSGDSNWFRKLFFGETESSLPVASCYLYPEDAQHFHTTLKTVCDKHDSGYYPKFKKWCDTYFFIPHRNETRGVGGIFFDDVESNDASFQFVKDCGQAFIDSYIPILERRINQPYTSEMKEWQQIRRGRYVEFNLVYDRGTKFGLATPGARIESILMSLPLTARWEYQNLVKDGSRESELLQVLKTPKEWAI